MLRTRQRGATVVHHITIALHIKDSADECQIWPEGKCNKTLQSALSIFVGSNKKYPLFLRRQNFFEFYE
jgi:hypothetical protein